MDITWQEIADGLKLPQDRKLIRETVVVFYSAFETNIDTNCDITIRGIGRFKGTGIGRRQEAAIKKKNKHKIRHRNKLVKRRQRLWAFKKFDDHWAD